MFSANPHPKFDTILNPKGFKKPLARQEVIVFQGEETHWGDTVRNEGQWAQAGRRVPGDRG